MSKIVQEIEIYFLRILNSNLEGVRLKTVVINFSLDVSANTSYSTKIPYDDYSIARTAIFTWNIVWTNTKNDSPIRIVYYQNPLSEIVHSWDVSQRVNFSFRGCYY